ncbi:hypothetical protein Gogos_011631 [Gossypium gossypioides]|uniref:Uncharacterized protein n=1 Tax=Gossypium gossypioides TaxID=34282 RepID=A0A7J9BPX4_GOSGO|nr:hypothetical protein [Gossypium gossypioides]
MSSYKDSYCGVTEHLFLHEKYEAAYATELEAKLAKLKEENEELRKCRINGNAEKSGHGDEHAART